MNEEQISETVSPEITEPAKPKCPYAYLSHQFRIIEEVITLDDAKMRRTPGFRSKKCLLMVALTKGEIDIEKAGTFLLGYFIENSQGDLKWNYTDNKNIISEASFFEIGMIIKHRAALTDYSMVLLDESELAKEPKKKKFDCEKVLNPTLIALAQIAPGNPTLRAHLQAIFRSPPPEEIKTWMELKNWMEFNFDPPMLASYQMRPYGALSPVDRERMRNRMPEPTALVFPVECQIMEIGNVQFSCPRKGKSESSISQKIVKDWIWNGHTIEGIVAMSLTILKDEQVKDRISASSIFDPEMDLTAVEYSNYEVESFNEPSYQASPESVKESLLAFIKINYGENEAQAIIDRK